MTKYWIVVDNAHQGPFSIEQLTEMELSPQTYAWHPGLPKWTRMGEIPELADIVKETEPAAESEVSLQETVTEHAVAPNVPATSSRPLPPPPPPRPPVITGPSVSVEKAEEVKNTADNACTEKRKSQCPPNYLAWAIVTAVVFFLPLGIVAIIYSSKVNGAWATGQADKARKYSEYAAWYSNIAFVAGLIWFPFSTVISMMFI